ncbi:MAG TPA: hypothetical protein VFR31_00345, partial [Thermoanaerobaculia bacterium]|nr:hypothetical protein [Thermoanaerobaculia bacterium]
EAKCIMSKRHLLLFVLMLVAALPASASGWSTLPLWGGDVRSLALHPDDPDMVFAGTSAGQLYLSRDAGRSWRDAGSHLPVPGWVVGTLRFDPNKKDRLWVGLWGVWGGGHVAYSDDLGKSWVARASGLPEEPVYTMALVPGREGRIYVGTLSGVWATDDSGESWRRLTASIPDAQKVTSLLVDADDPDAVIAGTWRRAYKTNDGGRTWGGIFEGMVLDSEVFSLTPVPGRSGEIWATTCGWVYRSLDRGLNWERFKEGFEERRTPSFSALMDGKLLAGTVAGVHVSADGGKTWKRTGDPALAINLIMWHPKRPERIYFATEGSGVWISPDSAATFRPSSEGMTNTRVSFLANFGEELMVALVHAGPFSGIHISRDRGKTFEGAGFNPLPTVLDVSWYEGRIYAATERGLFERRGTAWFRLKELGETRVEQVIGEGPQLVARTATGLWEMKGGKFVQRKFEHGTPRSAAFFGGSLWVTDGQGLYRLTSSSNDTVAMPFSGGRLHKLQDQLLLWGPGGAWARPAPDTDWVELTEKASRLLPTGHERWSSLMVSGDTVRLFDREARKFRIIEVPVPARDISAALVLGGRLMLGTLGHGVLVRDMGEDLFPSPAAPPAPVAAGGTER